MLRTQADLHKDMCFNCHESARIDFFPVNVIAHAQLRNSWYAPTNACSTQVVLSVGEDLYLLKQQQQQQGV